MALGSTPQDEYSPRDGPRVLFAIIVVVLIICAVLGTVTVLGVYVAITPPQLQQHTYQIIDTVITVQAGTYKSAGVHVPAGNTHLLVSGSFSTTPAGTSIEVLVMNEANYSNWRSGSSAINYYDSGMTASGTIGVHLPDGDDTYYVVYANFSSSAAQVQTNVVLYYQS